MSFTDWVVKLSPPAVTRAITQTGVGLLPACTDTWASPSALVNLVTGPAEVSSRIPPLRVDRSKLTSAFGIGWLLLSTTLNLTSEDSWKSAAPVPFNTIVSGSAETNWMLATPGASTCRLAERDTEVPATEDVIVSVRAQPLSS